VLTNEVLLRDITEGRIKGKASRKEKAMLSDHASPAKYQEVKRAEED